MSPICSRPPGFSTAFVVFGRMHRPVEDRVQAADLVDREEEQPIVEMVSPRAGAG